MMHLLSIQGKHAIGYYIDSDSIENFKTVVRGVVSGCVFVVSSKYKTDIFYNSTEEKNEAIIKIWSLYENDKAEFDGSMVKQFSGDMKVLSYYFDSLIVLHLNWYWDNNYKDCFEKSYTSETNNILANTLLNCDYFLMQNKYISSNRSALMDYDKYQHIKQNAYTDAELIDLNQLLESISVN